MPDYLDRVVDRELDDLLPGVAALALEGPRGVGKTATAIRRARTVHRLDDASQRQIVEADPERIATGDSPVLVDEWQRVPDTWDAVRRAVDADRTPGRFLLTGSAAPRTPPTHSGAGRIVSVRMRPLTLAERHPDTATVSLSALLTGTAGRIGGRSPLTLADYTEEILASGFPGLRGVPGRALRTELDGYLIRALDRDVPDQGVRVRNTATLRRWLTAYAAATATTTSHERIRDAATGEGATPARTTVLSYRRALESMWLLDPVPGWSPTRNRLARISNAPKHHLTDPALAARLLRIDSAGLLSGGGATPWVAREGSLLGSLFESLATLCVRVYAQAAEATVGHLRTRAGEHEIDLIIEGEGGRILGVEVKLARTVSDDDSRHLRWLRAQLPEDVADLVVLTTGPEAYRRPDGIAVVPLALLGP